jgi:hypothetical protein
MVAGICAQSDPLAAIREALASKYPTAAGARVTLQKGDLLAADATSALVISSSFRNGKISRGLMGQVASASSGTRTFAAGEKVSVTRIEVTAKGIAFRLESDQDSGARYRADLHFPFAKGAPPAPDEALAMVGEVLAPEAAPSPPAATENNPPSRPAAEPSPVQEIRDWDSRYGHITREDVERINDTTLRFDLNYLRVNPAALDEKPVMQYFAALNNCNRPDVERALFNELDYPPLAEFYKAKAAEILASLPRTIPDVSFDRAIGGTQVGTYRLWTQVLSLGEYDRQRKVFPIRFPGKDQVEIPEALSTDSMRRKLSKTCPAVQRAANAVVPYLPAQYEIAVRPMAFRELPMDEESARRYIDSAGADRNVFLVIDSAILDSAPRIERGTNNLTKATLQARVVRVRVIDSRTQKSIGAVYDDGTMRPDAPVVEAKPAPPAPAPKPGKENWDFSDRMYNIRMSVYVSLAADACGWPLTDTQSANLKRFLDEVSTRGSFNERYQYNVARTRVKNSISAQGRMNYCANPSERRDFDKYAAMVAPLGPLAASGKQ